MAELRILNGKQAAKKKKEAIYYRCYYLWHSHSISLYHLSSNRDILCFEYCYYSFRDFDYSVYYTIKSEMKQAVYRHAQGSLLFAAITNKRE